MRKVIIAAPSSVAPVWSSGTQRSTAKLTGALQTGESDILKPNETKKVFTYIIGIPGGKDLSILFVSVFLEIFKRHFALEGSGRCCMPAFFSCHRSVAQGKWGQGDKCHGFKKPSHQISEKSGLFSARIRFACL